MDAEEARTKMATLVERTTERIVTGGDPRTPLSRAEILALAQLELLVEMTDVLKSLVPTAPKATKPRRAAAKPKPKAT